MLSETKHLAGILRSADSAQNDSWSAWLLSLKNPVTTIQAVGDIIRLPLRAHGWGVGSQVADRGDQDMYAGFAVVIISPLPVLAEGRFHRLYRVKIAIFA